MFIIFSIQNRHISENGVSLCVHFTYAATKMTQIRHLASFNKEDEVLIKSLHVQIGCNAGQFKTALPNRRWTYST